MKTGIEKCTEAHTHTHMSWEWVGGNWGREGQRQFRKCAKVLNFRRQATTAEQNGLGASRGVVLGFRTQDYGYWGGGERVPSCGYLSPTGPHTHTQQHSPLQLPKPKGQSDVAT